MRWLIAILIGLAAPAHADWRDEVIYFIMIDRFSDGNPDNNQDADPTDPLAFHGGDLAGITQHLGDIASLGVTAIWLTPVVQQVGPIEVPEGLFWGHHGYWAEDFQTLDPRYGTEADLTTLVDAAHDRGIKVILDVVYNHVGYGSSVLTDHPDWVRTGDDCGGDDVTLCLAGLPDLRTDLPLVRDWLFEAHLGLAERTGIDGFRLDTFKHVEPEFWQAHRQAVRDRLGPDFFLLGEIWDGDKYLAEPPFAADTLDAVFDFSFRDRTLKFLTGVESTERYARWFTNRATVPEGKVMAQFLSNHDMPMMLAMLRGDTTRLRAAFALLMFAEGPPVISCAEEIGRAGGPWPNNREDYDWSGGDQTLRDDIASLIALRSEFPEMRAGPVETLVADGNVLALVRGDIAVAVNRGRDPVPIPTSLTDDWTILWGEDSATLAPGGAVVMFHSGP